MLKNGKYCNQLNETDNIEICENCIENRFGIKENIILKWRKECQEFLDKCDKIITPSENTKQLYLKVYNNLKIEVIEHGVQYIDTKITNKKRSGFPLR